MGRNAFGEYLVVNGLLSREALKRALGAQSALECRLGSVILDLGLMTEPALLKALGRHSSARTVSAVELSDISPEVLAMVPPRFALRHQVVPFRLSGKTLSVAAIDPQDLLVEDELSQLTGSMIATFVALEVRLDQALARYYGKQLSVQAASLLKRLKGAGVEPAEVAEPADVAAPAVQDDTAQGAEAEALTEVVELRKSSRPAKVLSHRKGVPTPRKPDDSVVLEVSESELADFPSLRRALEDSGSGMVSVTLAGREVKGRAPAEAAPPAPETPAAAPPSDAPEPDARPVEPAAAAEPPIATEEPARQPEPFPKQTPEARLSVAVETMQNAEMREDIADAILAFCAPYLRRRLLLAVRKDTIMGWRGEGDGIDPLWAKSMSIPTAEPSVFSSLNMDRDYWCDALPANSGNQDLLLGLGGEEPSECVILPIGVKDKPIAYLYGDNLDDGLGDVPVDALRRLAVKAGLAFQVYMLRNKMRIE
jgi:hypothetical protein